MKNLLLWAAMLLTTGYSSAQLPGCATTINTFPYTEGFEVNTGNWSNIAGDQFDWTRDSGGTTSSATGPGTGSGSTWYMYIETSSPRVNGDEAWLESDCFDFSALTAPTMDFDYHMYGGTMGTLELLISTDGVAWTSIWSLSGDQGNTWNSASVDLSAYAGQTVGLRFRGVNGTSYTGDAAIDNIHIYNLSPMTYVSSTVTQTNTSNIEKCATEVEVICVQVVTAGGLSPIDLTQLRVLTDGSTAPLTDFIDLKVYYTGTSATYSTTSLFGTAFTASTGTNIDITGTQTLAEGTNYFWITYDMSVAATNGNVIDGQCTQITVDGSNENPSVTNPAGNRTIIDCARACPVGATVFFEDFETANSWQTAIPGTTYGSRWSGAPYNGGFHGWLNLVNGLSNVDVFDNHVSGLYTNGCSATISYWYRHNTTGMDVEYTLIDDNGNTIDFNHVVTPAAQLNVYQNRSVTFTPTTPGFRFIIHINSTGGAGVDVAWDDFLVTQCCDIPILLPVELNNFTTDCSQDQTLLKWETASEMKNDYFTIERSSDGIEYQVITTIKGSGTSNSMNYYEWNDIDSPRGTNYYRLSQTDYDGSTEILDTRSVNCSIDESVSIYPNPFSDIIHIESQSSGTITMSDITGKIVLTKRFTAGVFKSDVSNLSEGTYLIKTILDNGTVSESKLIKLN